jgi:hypothetical protein
MYVVIKGMPEIISHKLPYLALTSWPTSSTASICLRIFEALAALSEVPVRRAHRFAFWRLVYPGTHCIDCALEDLLAAGAECLPQLLLEQWEFSADCKEHSAAKHFNAGGGRHVCSPVASLSEISVKSLTCQCKTVQLSRFTS